MSDIRDAALAGKLSFAMTSGPRRVTPVALPTWDSSTPLPVRPRCSRLSICAIRKWRRRSGVAWSGQSIGWFSGFLADMILANPAYANAMFNYEVTLHGDQSESGGEGR